MAWDIRLLGVLTGGAVASFAFATTYLSGGSALIRSDGRRLVGLTVALLLLGISAPILVSAVGTSTVSAISIGATVVATLLLLRGLHARGTTPLQAMRDAVAIHSFRILILAASVGASLLVIVSLGLASSR
jgi:uncharacterized membrane protein